MRCALIVAWTLAALGCVRSATVDCGDGSVCANDQICVHATADVTVCAPPGTRDACAGAGVADGEPCNGDLGRCYDGACLPISCGDRIVDPVKEQCDDGNNVPGDKCSSDCRSNEKCGNGVVDPIGGEICDDGNLVGHDGCTGACTLETPRWTEVTIATPRPDVPIGMAYLPSRARVVALFDDGSGGTLATWEWNGTGWQRITTTVAPQTRQYFGTVADARRDVLVVVGGTAGGGTSIPDLWELGGDRWSLATATLVPRFAPAVAYDPRRGRVVVFGGRDDRGIVSLILDDIYEWDGATATELMPSGPKPTARWGAAMVYDPRRDEIVMFGGQDNAKRTDETWTFKSGAWTKHVVPGPSARVYARMIVDATGVLLYGGEDNAGDSDEMWRWDGAQWTSIGPAPPGRRSNFGFAYDGARGRAVVYGGSSDSSTWEWTGGRWQKVTTTVPAIGEYAVSAFDPLRHQGIVHTAAVTYAMRDGSWTQLAQAPAPNRTSPGLVFDIARDRAVMFGGVSNAGPFLDETLVLAPGDLAPAWTALATVHRPPPRLGPGMAYDSDRGITVLFGGTSGMALGDTWELDTDWHERTVSPAPSPRSGHAMAYDPVRRRTILFGGDDGNTQSAETWAWDGTAWTQLHPTGRIPTARKNATLTWNPARRRLVLLDGTANVISSIDDAWEWTGDSWLEIKPASTPGARSAHLAVPASDASGLYVVAGGNTSGVLADQWLLSWSEPDRLYERCVVDADRDGDGAGGCDDPDCWWACTPLCTPTLPCAPSAPRCGDSAVAPNETCQLCPDDATACPLCGDLTCAAAESPGTCPGDCP